MKTTMKTTMRPELIQITPALAEDYLQYNTGNRRLPVNNSAHYERLINSGEFILTHQALAFTGTPESPGRLLDGQTRLTAIKNSGLTVQQWVFWGCSERIFAVVDNGKPRSFSDHHGWDQKQVALMKSLYFFIENRTRRPLKTEADKIMIGFGREFSNLMETCPTKRKSISTAPVIAGFCVAMRRDRKNAESIAGFYRMLILSDIGSVPPGFVRLFIKLTEQDTQSRWGTIDGTIALVAKVCEEPNWNLTKLYVPDGKYVSSLRAWAGALCGFDNQTADS
jgi:hypothetical protein